MQIYSCLAGKNNELIKNIETLYLKPGMAIADLTYGRGNFWTMVDLTNYEFFPSDINTGMDLRNTGYPDNRFDVVVIDPPYAIGVGRKSLNANYGLEHVDNIYDIQDLYFKGILEARRILARDGLLLIKCQDVRHGNKDYWMHVDILNYAQSLGFQAVDLFVLKNSINVPDYNQKISRKNHSFMWVFKSNTGRRR